MTNEKYNIIAEKIRTASWRGIPEPVVKKETEHTSNVQKNRYFRVSLLICAIMSIIAIIIRIILFSSKFYDKDLQMYNSGIKYALYAPVMLSLLVLIGVAGAARYILSHENGKDLSSDNQIFITSNNIHGKNSILGISFTIICFILAVLLGIFPFFLTIMKSLSDKLSENSVNFISFFGNNLQFFACILAFIGSVGLISNTLLPNFYKFSSKKNNLFFDIIYSISLSAIAGFFVIQMICVNLNITSILLRSPTRYFIILSAAMQSLFYLSEAKNNIFLNLNGSNLINSNKTKEESYKKPGFWTGCALLSIFLGSVDSLPVILTKSSVSAPQIYFHFIEFASVLFIVFKLYSSHVKICKIEKPQN